jgi:hypothetical protein
MYHILADYAAENLRIRLERGMGMARLDAAIHCFGESAVRATGSHYGRSESMPEVWP